MTEHDPHIGEVYESLDTRDPGRRIRVLELHPSQRNPRPYDRHEEKRTYFRAIRVDEFGNVPPGEQLIKISDTTLDTRYRKVSR